MYHWQRNGILPEYIPIEKEIGSNTWSVLKIDKTQLREKYILFEQSKRKLGI